MCAYVRALRYLPDPPRHNGHNVFSVPSRERFYGDEERKIYAYYYVSIKWSRVADKVSRSIHNKKKKKIITINK